MTEHLIARDPFLGPEWMPLAEAIVRVNDGTRTGFWTLQFLPAGDDVPPVFVQAAPRDDHLHVEVGGRPGGSVTLEERDAALRLSGWLIAADQADTDPEFARTNPLPYRRVTRDLRDTADLVALLRTLAVVLAVDPYAPFTFGDRWVHLVEWLGPFDRVGAEAFALSRDASRLADLPSPSQPSPTVVAPQPPPPLYVPTEPDVEPPSEAAAAPPTDTALSEEDIIAMLPQGRLNRVDFSRAALHRTSFAGARVEECRFSAAQLDDADFGEAQFIGSTAHVGEIHRARPFAQTRSPLEVVQRILDTMAAEELCVPHLPADLHVPLALYEDANFGTAGWAFPGARDAYMFEPLVEQIARGDWSPRVFFGLWGHGMNSYAWTYEVVVDRVAIVAQIGRGHLWREPAAVSAHWSSLMTAVERFLDDIWRSEVSDEGLIVCFNPLRARTGCAIVPTTGTDPRALWEEIATDRGWGSDASASVFFDRAMTWAEEEFG